MALSLTKSPTFFSLSGNPIIFEVTTTTTGKTFHKLHLKILLNNVEIAEVSKDVSGGKAEFDISSYLYQNQTGHFNLDNAVTEFDLERLKKLIADSQRAKYRGSDYLAKLQTELERAEVVKSREVGSNVVTMNSTVVMVDLETGKEETYTLVFPDDADARQGKVSVLAPIGTAMLGYEVGDVFEWEVPAGRRRLQVKKILYQPEAAGDYHL